MKFSAEKFYDELAGEYDDMSEFRQRLKQTPSIFQYLKDKYKLKSAVDAGCGTGYHTFVMMKLGLSVAPIDISKKMLNAAKNNAKKLNFSINPECSPLTELTMHVRTKHDSVFCLGNTLANILTSKDLLSSIKNFYDILNRNGILVIQILNYDRILRACEKVQNIKEINGRIFIRFYDYEKRFIRFNILKLEKVKNKFGHSMMSVKLHPWLSSDLVNQIRRAGFKGIRLYGNLELGQYSKRSSHDLVIVAKKK